MMLITTNNNIAVDSHDNIKILVMMVKQGKLLIMIMKVMKKICESDVDSSKKMRNIILTYQAMILTANNRKGIYINKYVNK